MSYVGGWSTIAHRNAVGLFVWTKTAAEAAEPSLLLHWTLGSSKATLDKLCLAQQTNQGNVHVVWPTLPSQNVPGLCKSNSEMHGLMPNRVA